MLIQVPVNLHVCAFPDTLIHTNTKDLLSLQILVEQLQQLGREANFREGEITQPSGALSSWITSLESLFNLEITQKATI